MAIILNSHAVSRQASGWQQQAAGIDLVFRYAVSSRHDGNMSFLYGPAEDITHNRLSFFQRLGVHSERVVPLSLGLSNGVHWLDQPLSFSGTSNPGFPSEGVWSVDRMQVLFLFVADCFPIAMYDESTGALGIFHAGRAELEAGLLADFLKLGLDHGIHAKQVRVFVGPGICSAHYMFDELPFNHRGVSVSDADGRFHLDLRADIQKQLLSCGISRDKIVEDPRCTYESDDLFSHRRDRSSQEGRFALMVTHHV